MKLFQMDDYEYWAAPDLESAKQAYIKSYGADCAEHCEDASEVSNERLDSMTVDQSENYDGSGPIVTARQQLEQEIADGGTFPRMIFAHDY